MPMPELRQVLPPAGVMPGPVPMQVDVGQAHGTDGTAFVVLTFRTPVGTAIYFLPSDLAKQLGGNLTRLGGAGKVMLAQGPLPAASGA
jgi:hypothetical protein